MQRATASLGVQAAQLPKIGIELENIAAALAEAQQSGKTVISTLESQLRGIDNELGRALALEDSGDLTPAEEDLVEDHIAELVDDAISDTKSAVVQLRSIRNGYSDHLQKSLATLRVQDGYDPAPIQGIDDDQRGPGDRNRNAVNSYNATQRARDEALLNSSGPMTPEKAEAAARLCDYTTATNRAADPDAQRLASERLNDFVTARIVGPLPVDRVMGGDARTRAQMRLEWQKKLEQGLSGAAPMTPDQVTQLLDNSEQQGRVMVMRQAAKALEQRGMWPSTASAVVSQMAQGMPLSAVAHYDATLVGTGGAGLEASAAAVSNGAHNLPGSMGVLSRADAELLASVGKRLGWAGSVADLALAGVEVSEGAPGGQTIGQAVGGVGGGMAGGWVAGAIGGSMFGPGGAFVGAIIGSVFGGLGGGKVGGVVGSQLDH
ncbi:hypothetical protein CKJ54_24570 [Mycobacterium marseillense]|uniref:Predicted hydrolase N-terminal domain-containing protein n=1 Tax=Mycobacterium marseillense TaxID=701042 RepID=A0AAD0E1B4_9MYCO|nr:hypothetical protein CKJ54_24570 [Mycobacterium marseillense]